MAVSANLLAAPVAAPLLIAALILLLARWGGRRLIRHQIALTALALCFNFAVALLIFQATAGQGERLVLQMGAWSAPYGITVYGDGLSATLLLLTALVAMAVYPFAVATIDYHRARMGFHPLYLFLLMGVNGAFLSGDLFNLYVFFEVLLMASFVLLTIGAQPAQTNSGIRYVVLNLLASTVFLVAAGIAYGTLGTLNMAQIAERLPLASPAVRTLFAGLLLVGFGSKAAIFPLFFWLPASYHTPPPAVTALFGGLLTKVGVYTLFRSFTLFFPELLISWQPTLLTIAGATMLVGALGALAQPGIRRVLSFHIISHVGFMLMGLAVALSGNKLAIGFGLGAAVLYLCHHMIIKTALIMAGGAVELHMGSDRLASIGGLVTRHPFLAFLFFMAAISLAGVPPFSGFVSKLSLLQITLDTRHWLVSGVSIFASLLTMLNMMRLWRESFWGDYKRPSRVPTRILQSSLRQRLMLTPIAVLVLLSLGLGILGGPAFRLSMRVAQQALDRQAYIDAVSPAATFSTKPPSHFVPTTATVPTFLTENAADLARSPFVPSP
ncbi:MAG: proton-conducting transporter membrane subunit [Caldilineaceae bacterium]|nr:proton-conducting transporter membrane subunit [Caldilineaceae bacterium]